MIYNNYDEGYKNRELEPGCWFVSGKLYEGFCEAYYVVRLMGREDKIPALVDIEKQIICKTFDYHRMVLASTRKKGGQSVPAEITATYKYRQAPIAIVKKLKEIASWASRKKEEIYKENQKRALSDEVVLFKA